MATVVTMPGFVHSPFDRSAARGRSGVRHIDHGVFIHSDSARLAELPGTGARASPLPQSLAVGGVFKDSRIAVAVGDEDGNSVRRVAVRRAVPVQRAATNQLEML